MARIECVNAASRKPEIRIGDIICLNGQIPNYYIVYDDIVDGCHITLKNINGSTWLVNGSTWLNTYKSLEDLNKRIWGSGDVIVYQDPVLQIIKHGRDE